AGEPIPGRGVHLRTHQPALAVDAARQYREVFGRMNGYKKPFQIGLLKDGLTDAEARQQYNAPITIGPDSLFKFDRLMDQTGRVSGPVQRGHTMLLTDEIDSIINRNSPHILSRRGDKV